MNLVSQVLSSFALAPKLHIPTYVVLKGFEQGTSSTKAVEQLHKKHLLSHAGIKEPRSPDVTHQKVEFTTVLRT